MTTLEQVIRAVESSNNAHAMRFEPDLFKNDPQWVAEQERKIMSICKCSEDTALAIDATSYGLYQLIGANIYALGYDKDIIEFCSSGSDQLSILQKFLAGARPSPFDPNEDVSAWPESRFAAFAAFYNGPDFAPAYIAAMKKVIA